MLPGGIRLCRKGNNLHLVVWLPEGNHQLSSRLRFFNPPRAVQLNLSFVLHINHSSPSLEKASTVRRKESEGNPNTEHATY